MKKEIKFSLVYRDMFQSSGKFQPLAEQLEKIAPVIVEMGCFARVETNGGAFEQVNLMAGENPNKAVRAFTKYFHKAGIQTHMLDRALNALRMFPVPADVRRLMYKVKKAQGTDITRIFCGLNDVRNIIPSIKYALEAGMIPQATLCITSSPIHTVEYYSTMADTLINAGASEICLKDMAGIGRPAFLGKLVKSIKEKHPDIIIQYHGHSGPGLSMASILEVCENGCDIIDTAIEPLSWGKVHPDIISVQAMLNFVGKVKDITGGGVNAGIEVTGLGAGLDGILDCMAPLGRVSLLGCTRSSDFTIDYYRKVHFPGIQLIGAHTNARPINESYPGYFTHEDDIKSTLRLCKGGRINLKDVIEEIHSPQNCHEVYTRLINEPDFPTFVQFDWSMM